ncbi:MAG: bifunctional phosphoribosyl-AMP cyclohydrolase/phosphoribosyl-ATP diphosphatase HisIE [Nitrospinae bacterium]|nr:bifunctional phosphoribosyl-AMP cyclohydrolase/phosphoribosyl-ATP diphosphatase HisIE [Nitrospinota bacterium]
MNIEDLKFDEKGLIPAIVQDAASGKVLMLAYMNSESIKMTIDSGYTHFWSRSRQSFWKKGETSGNVQEVVEISYDCDKDTLLVKVRQTGVACHTGNKSCFFETLSGEKVVPSGPEIIAHLREVILDRKNNLVEGSYVSYLFREGKDKILKKIGEEAAESVIASKNDNRDEIICEVADLWFHSLVLLGYHDISPEDIYKELSKRIGKKSKTK